MTQTIQMPVTDLTGAALAWAVGKAEGREMHILPAQYLTGPRLFAKEGVKLVRWKPDADWGQTGPLIEKYHVKSSYNGQGFKTPTGEYWCAYTCKNSGAEQFPSGSGGSPQIAICRAIVVTALGETADIPAELLTAGGAA